MDKVPSVLIWADFKTFPANLNYLGLAEKVMIVRVGNRQQATGNSFTPIVDNFLDSKKLEMQGF